jgi:hypothetical protein
MDSTLRQFCDIIRDATGIIFVAEQLADSGKATVAGTSISLRWIAARPIMDNCQFNLQSIN